MSAGLFSANTVRCKNIGIVAAAESTVIPRFKNARRVCIVDIKGSKTSAVCLSSNQHN